MRKNNTLPAGMLRYALRGVALCITDYAVGVEVR
jgi:hypothetical protein